VPQRPIPRACAIEGLSGLPSRGHLPRVSHDWLLVLLDEIGMVFSGTYKGKGIAMTCLFVQVRCRPGTAYDVAAQIVMREIHSELYSTSGDFDLMLKLYLPNDEDIGRFINDNLLNIDGIERTYTIQTFKAFK
jgi:DNA-binding Lrp family transcriptional regulator